MGKRFNEMFFIEIHIAHFDGQDGVHTVDLQTQKVEIL